MFAKMKAHTFLDLLINEQVRINELEQKLIAATKIAVRFEIEASKAHQRIALLEKTIAELEETVANQSIELEKAASFIKMVAKRGNSMEWKRIRIVKKY